MLASTRSAAMIGFLLGRTEAGAQGAGAQEQRSLASQFARHHPLPACLTHSTALRRFARCRSRHTRSRCRAACRAW